MQTRTTHTTIDAELLRWLLFSVCLAFLPLTAKQLLPELYGEHLRPVDVLKDGELLLIGVSIAGVGFSDILASGQTGKLAQSALFVSAVCFGLASLGYGAVHVAASRMSAAAIVRWSYVAFVGCVIAGGAGVLIKEWNK